MSSTRAALIFGLLMMLPASAPAQSHAGTSTTQQTASGQSSWLTRAVAQTSKTNTATMHATRGVVKFVDAHTLVITRSPRYGKEISFTLTPSTERVGDLTVGSVVDVRYRSEAKLKIATAVTVEHSR